MSQSHLSEKECDIYKKCKYYNPPRYRNVFLWTIVVFATIVIAGYCYTTSTFKTNQNRIVKIQKDHYNDVDSMFCMLHENIITQYGNYDELFKKLIADSTFQKLNTKQITKSNIDSDLKQIIIGLSQSLSHKELISELKQDSLLINNRLARTSNETKILLELEFNRIQHEFNIIALWAGILTIVFLIFSFYSIFKTDDLMKQAKEHHDEIKRLRDMTTTDVDALKTKTEEDIKILITNISKEHNDTLKQSETKLQNIINKYQDLKPQSTSEQLTDLDKLLKNNQPPNV